MASIVHAETGSNQAPEQVTMPESVGSDNSFETERFQQALRDSLRYPRNLPAHGEKPKLVHEFRRHFDKLKDSILLRIPADMAVFRMKAIEKKIRVQFHDCGLREDVTRPRADNPPPLRRFGSNQSVWDDEDDSEFKELFNDEDLNGAFGIKLEHKDETKELSLNTRFDPVCRFIFLEASAPPSRRYKVTEQLLLKILTYHYVSPSFLNFISSFGHSPLSGDSDIFLGGFRSHKSFAANSRLPALDRSGYHFQLAFELRTVFSPPGSTSGDMQPGERGVIALDEPRKQATTKWRLFPWLKPRPDEDFSESADPSSDSLDLWPVGHCAVYHHFDVENGKSLWIITAAEGETEEPFGDVRESRREVTAASYSSVHHRFQSALAVLTWLTDWSMSEFGFYIAALDDNLQILTRAYVEDSGSDTPVLEDGLKVLNRYMEKLDECAVALGRNLRVYRAILKFYSELLDPNKWNPQWISQDRAAILETLACFEENIQHTCNSTQEMLQRADVVKQMGTRRENTIHRLLQNRDVTTMKKLATVTYHDSSTMRVFASITLIFLPMSVVSTIFSTDIVKFQNTSTSAGFLGNWSPPAFVWWLGATILATALVYIGGEKWRQKTIKAVMGAETVAKTEEKGAASHGSWTRHLLRAKREARGQLSDRMRSFRVKLGGWIAEFRALPQPIPSSVTQQPLQLEHGVSVGGDASSAYIVRPLKYTDTERPKALTDYREGETVRERNVDALGAIEQGLG